MKKGCVTAAFIAVFVIGFADQTANAIGRKEFFEKLDEALRQTVTFEADIVQESRYPDGIVQRYSGKLAVSEEGRIAYDYELVGEYADPSLVREEPSQTLPADELPQPQHPERPKGVYITKGDRVGHYNPDQNLIVESSEDENLLIQLFRVLVGSGDFDLEAFKANHKIHRIRETVYEGVPVFVMIAQPKKSSRLYQRWSQGAENEMIEWNQELWVQRADMKPLRAVLTMDNESTSILLSQVRINEPVDPSLFLIDPGEKGQPRKVTRENLFPPVRGEVETLAPVEKPLQEIRIEE